MRLSRSSSTPNEIDILAGLLEASNIVESPDAVRLRAESRCQGPRPHMMGGPRGEVGPFDLSRRRRAAGDEDGLVWLALNRCPIPLVAGVHAGPKQARVYLRHQAVVLRPRLYPIPV